MNKKVPFIDNSRQSPLWVARDDGQLCSEAIPKGSGMTDIDSGFRPPAQLKRVQLLALAEDLNLHLYF
jgi:hypothetical protein